MKQAWGIWLLVAAGSFAATGCVTKKANIVSKQTKRDRLFPLGLYKHDVRLVIPKATGEPPIDFEFNGVVKLSADQVQLVALSHFGTTVFKLSEELKTGEVKTEVFVDEMKKHEERLPRYYKSLRALFSAPYPAEKKNAKFRWKKTNERGFPLEACTVGLDKDADFRFEKYDQENIPGEIFVTHPEYTVTVKVTGYEI